MRRSTQRLAWIVALVVAGPSPAAAQGTTSPWRLATAIESPDWLTFGATHRTRYEHLFHQFRPGAPGDDLALSLRTTLHGELRVDAVAIGVELLDARLYGADANAPLDTTLIDPVEILRAYARVEVEDAFAEGGRLRLHAGRLTMDAGSRRLLARNEFRNTINAFTGVDVDWRSPAGDVARVFAVVPVVREPSDRAALADNAIELDHEGLGTLLAGVWFTSRELPEAITFEAYALGLDEQDTRDDATANRRLVTPGVRLARAAAPDRLDLELEAVFQAGVSRASRAADDAADLDHLAFFAHAQLGYTIDVPTRPRIVLQGDYASGDADPDDGVNGRFDTLFGARRFELGPTGLWGALGRSNLISPGLRVEVAPHAMVDVFAAYRPAWLAQSRDAWTAAGLRDPTGASGDFVGHHLELRARFRVPGNFTLDVGFAHLFRGPFAATAGGGDPTYLYAQAQVEL